MGDYPILIDVGETLVISAEDGAAGAAEKATGPMFSQPFKTKGFGSRLFSISPVPWASFSFPETLSSVRRSPAASPSPYSGIP